LKAINDVLFAVGQALFIQFAGILAGYVPNPAMGRSAG